MTKQLLEIFPDDEEALTNLEVFQEELKNNSTDKEKRKLLNEVFIYLFILLYFP